VNGKEVTRQVEYPDDETLVFDVETLVLHENCPVIAVAASSTAWFEDFFGFIENFNLKNKTKNSQRYSWCSQRLIENDFMYLSSLQLNDLIPMESNDACLRKSQKRIVIGHNVGFDRSFIREQYFLEVKLF